jgi:hypothetical protein
LELATAFVRGSVCCRTVNDGDTRSPGALNTDASAKYGLESSATMRGLPAVANPIDNELKGTATSFSSTPMK